MHINNEEEARAYIARWQTDPTGAQLKNLRMAKESLELSSLYYEQKGNGQGVARAEASLHLICCRIEEIQSAENN
ncbi:hypothetical protein ACHHRT_12485 [Desulfurivibrio sp. D14AmB]|uniref:hypothetical protein n=1 Tax=Desulfurivibrio sp. D14AmB TaxID=3374370 RepID=UPI00376F0E70